MVNKELKTNNVILNQLNEEYYVCRSRDFSTLSEHPANEYVIYEKPAGGGLYYIGAVLKTSNPQKVRFDGKLYSDKDALMGAVSAYNDARPFKSGCYDPMYRPAYNALEMIREYMERMGFVYDTWNRGNGSVFTKKDMHGREIFRLAVELDIFDDKVNTTIVQKNGAEKEIYMKANGVDDTISSINVLVLAEASALYQSAASAIMAMSDSYNSMNGVKEFDPNRFMASLFTDGTEASGSRDFKQDLIDRLEKALKAIKGE